MCSALALATLAGCRSTQNMMRMTNGMTPDQQAADVISSVRSDADIMGTLHLSNLGEINAGTLAQSRATDQAVRDFAAMMVRDHSNLDRQGNAMAQQWGIAPTMPNNQLPALAQREMDALGSAGSGAAFDRLYMVSQVNDHQRTLRIIDASINAAQRPELRAMLQNQVRPPVAQHLQLAQSIQSRIGMP